MSRWFSISGCVVGVVMGGLSDVKHCIISCMQIIQQALNIVYIGM